MLKEFRDFIAKGNVLDMAIGVVMASAFTSIVNSMVSDIIMPFVEAALGSTDFTSIVVKVAGITFRIGNFMQAVFTFLIISIVLFFVMKAVASLKNRFTHEEEEEEEEEVDPTEALLTEIRDLLREEKQSASK